MLVAAVLAALLIVPGFVLLYVLDQKSLLPEEGVHDEPGTSGTEFAGVRGLVLSAPKFNHQFGGPGNARRPSRRVVRTGP